MVVLAVQDFWRSRQDTVLCMTLVSGQNSSFFAAMADDTVADVVIVEAADVEVVDNESFVGSDWYAV